MRWLMPTSDIPALLEKQDALLESIARVLQKERANPYRDLLKRVGKSTDTAP